jgi:hypothetical protein
MIWRVLLKKKLLLYSLRIREPLRQAGHIIFTNEFQGSKIRNGIKGLCSMMQNTVRRERQKLRYALSGNFLPDLQWYVVDRILDATVKGTDSDDSRSDLLSSLINGLITHLPIKDWINDSLILFLSGGVGEETKSNWGINMSLSTT